MSNWWEAYPVVPADAQAVVPEGEQQATSGNWWEAYPAMRADVGPKALVAGIDDDRKQREEQARLHAAHQSIETYGEVPTVASQIVLDTTSVANRLLGFSERADQNVRDAATLDQALRERDAARWQSEADPTDMSMAERAGQYVPFLKQGTRGAARSLGSAFLGAKGAGALKGVGKIAVGGARGAAAAEGGAAGAISGMAQGAGGAARGAMATGGGSAYGAIGLASAQEANRAITEGSDAGLEGQALASYVASQGIIEAAPAVLMQRLGLGGVESIIAGPAIRGGLKAGFIEAIKATGQEIPEELATEVLHAVATEYSAVDPRAMDSEQMSSLVADTVLQTVLMGAGAGAIKTATGDIQARLDRLQAMRAKGFISEDDAKKEGIVGKTRKERLANTDAEIKRLTEGTWDSLSQIGTSSESPGTSSPAAPQGPGPAPGPAQSSGEGSAQPSQPISQQVKRAQDRFRTKVADRREKELWSDPSNPLKFAMEEPEAAAELAKKPTYLSEDFEQALGVSTPDAGLRRQWKSWLKEAISLEPDVVEALQQEPSDTLSYKWTRVADGVQPPRSNAVEVKKTSFGTLVRLKPSGQKQEQNPETLSTPPATQPGAPQPEGKPQGSTVPPTPKPETNTERPKSPNADWDIIEVEGKLYRQNPNAKSNVERINTRQPIDPSEGVALITKDKFGKPIPEATMKARQDFVDKAKPGVEFEIEGFKGSSFKVMDDGTIMETTSRREMGSVQSRANIVEPGQITWKETPSTVGSSEESGKKPTTGSPTVSPDAPAKPETSMGKAASEKQPSEARADIEAKRPKGLPPLKPGFARVVHIGRAGDEESLKGGLDYSKYGMLQSTARAWSDESQVEYDSKDPRFAGGTAYVFDVPESEMRQHSIPQVAPGKIPGKYYVGSVAPQAESKPSADAAESKGTAAPQKDAPRRGKVGDMLAAGEVVTTSSGRQTTPFPNVDVSSDRKTQNTVKRVDKWLHENAVEEARSRGDDFNLTQFENEDPTNLPPASKDAMEEYLFGEQPPVRKPITKPLVPPADAAESKGTRETPNSETVDQSSKGLTEGFRSLPAKGQAAFETEWNKGGTSIKNLLYPENKNYRAEFEARTGIKLPKGVGSTFQAVEDWHNAGRPLAPNTASVSSDKQPKPEKRRGRKDQPGAMSNVDVGLQNIKKRFGETWTPVEPQGEAEQEAAALAKQFGLTPVFFTSDRSDQYARPGGYSNGVVFIKRGLGDAAVWGVVGDEIAHGTKLDLKDFAKSEEVEQAKKDYLAGIAEDQRAALEADPVRLEREAKAHIVRMFMEQKTFRDRLRESNPTLWRRIVDAVLSLFSDVKLRNETRQRVLDELRARLQGKKIPSEMSD